MKLPRCGLCGSRDVFDITETGDGYVCFQETHRTAAVRESMKQPGWTGDVSPDSDYFCARHIARARELREMTIDAALTILREEFPNARALRKEEDRLAAARPRPHGLRRAAIVLATLTLLGALVWWLIEMLV